MDVDGRQGLPGLRRAARAPGRTGASRTPTTSPTPTAATERPARRRQPVDRRPTTRRSSGTAGHLHPGGLYTDLTITRNGQTRRLFRSKAKYYEPAGAVSWDVVHGGRRRRTGGSPSRRATSSPSHATYDVATASWYESMGIMPLAVTDVPRGGRGPVHDGRRRRRACSRTATSPRTTTTAGRDPGLPRPAQAARRHERRGHDQGLHLQPGRPHDARRGRPAGGRPARAGAARSATWTRRGTSSTRSRPARRPARGSSGIAYPLPNGAVTFDSGRARHEPRRASRRPPGGTRGRRRRTCSDGTYTYFCRIHPFMRGAFRVKG